jgi:hypothetical protein
MKIIGILYTIFSLVFSYSNVNQSYNKTIVSISRTRIALLINNGSIERSEIHISAFDSKNYKIINNPRIIFFKKIYYKHTNYVIEKKPYYVKSIKNNDIDINNHKYTHQTPHNYQPTGHIDYEFITQIYGMNYNILRISYGNFITF